MTQNEKKYLQGYSLMAYGIRKNTTEYHWTSGNACRDAIRTGASTIGSPRMTDPYNQGWVDAALDAFGL